MPFVLIFSELRIYMRSIFIVYFEYIVIDTRCGNNFIPSNIFFKATYIQHSPTAMHQDAFNVLCISRSVLICMFRLIIFVLYFSPLSFFYSIIITAYRKRRRYCFGNRVKDFLSHCARLLSRFKNFSQVLLSAGANLTWQSASTCERGEMD